MHQNWAGQRPSNPQTRRASSFGTPIRNEARTDVFWDTHRCRDTHGNKDTHPAPCPNRGFGQGHPLHRLLGHPYATRQGHPSLSGHPPQRGHPSRGSSEAGLRDDRDPLDPATMAVLAASCWRLWLSLRLQRWLSVRLHGFRTALRLDGCPCRPPPAASPDGCPCRLLLMAVPAASVPAASPLPTQPGRVPRLQRSLDLAQGLTLALRWRRQYVPPSTVLTQAILRLCGVGSRARHVGSLATVRVGAGVRIPDMAKTILTSDTPALPAKILLLRGVPPRAPRLKAPLR